MRGRRGEKKELGKGNEERGGDGENSNGAQFHGWVGVREGGSTTRMEEMHGEMAKTFIGPLHAVCLTLQPSNCLHCLQEGREAYESFLWMAALP